MTRPGGRPRKTMKAAGIPQQDYFTVQEAADLLGVHIHTVQARLRDGTLKGKKLGREWRIYADSLSYEKVDSDLNIERR